MLLGARQSLWRGGRLSAKSYVQEGLVLQLDGIENAGWGKHDSSAKVWKNLVGEDGVPIVTPWGWDGNSLSSIGRNTIHGNKLYNPVDYNEITLEALFDTGDDVNQMDIGLGIVAGVGGHDTGGAQRWTKACVRSAKIIIYEAPSPHGNPFSLSVVAKYGEFASLYDRATLRPKPVYDEGRGSGGASLMIYTSVVDVNKKHPHVYTLRFYNRTLTPEEIAQNYAVDKERFNLQ